MKRKFLLAGMLTLGVSAFYFGQTEAERQQITKNYDHVKLKEMGLRFENRAKALKKEAIIFAKKNNLPLSIQHENGATSELMMVENGVPIYYTNFNVDAAKSTRANHLNTGGSLGLSLDGQNMTAHVWDAGAIRKGHQEFGSRVSIKDNSNKEDNHATHVGGTIAAAGVKSNARGMGVKTKLHSYDWYNDISEATTAVRNGMILSNHSYGFQSASLPDWYFGAYIEKSASWDELMYNSPGYLMCVAAGNDGSNYGYDPSTGRRVLLNGSPIGGDSSNDYDKLTGHSTSKNALVVANANDANIDRNGNFISTSIAGSSSQGPTDDLRIKPDISGNGVNVYSPTATTNTSYDTYTGTSMATPNVVGTLVLVQQHFNNLENRFMLGAELKGLALHTADDAGREGPDANFGWGLLNAKKMVEVINGRGQNSVIENLTLAQGKTYTKTIVSDGVTPISVSISWYDPRGPLQSSYQLNSTTKRLVNDLDLRVVSTRNSDRTYYPWALTSRSTNAKKDNNSDNFERVDLGVVPAGEYKIIVSHKGTLRNSQQNYTLIATGVQEGAREETPIVKECTTPTNLYTTNITQNTATISWKASLTTGQTFTVEYKESNGTWREIYKGTSPSINLKSLKENTTHYWRVKVNCSSTSSSNYASASFTTKASTSTTSCANAYEPNNSISSATVITGLDKDYNAAIGTSSDVDYYKFTITTPGYLTIKLDNLSHDIDMVLYNTYNYRNYRIATSINSGTTPEIIKHKMTAGTYYIQVKPYSGYNANQCYRLRLEAGSTSFAEENNTTDLAASADSFNIFPNPVKDVLYVNVPEKLSKNAKIQIYNISGSLVKETSAETGKNKIDVNSLPVGAYILKLVNDLNTEVSKFIKK